jgi:signal transduction histidine kinase
MRNNRPYRYKAWFKWFLLVLGVLLFTGAFLYTDALIKELQVDAQRNLTFQIKTYEEAINSDNDAGFIFTEIIQKATFPIILTDADSNIVSWRNLDDFPDSKDIPRMSEEEYAELKQLVVEFDAMHEPISIRYQNSLLSRFHYGEQPIIRQLRLLPLIEGVVVTAFILIGYLGFSVLRKHEHDLMWVGMAKETAHQMGTPISSLMGWAMYLKDLPDVPRKPINEIEKDIDRLQIVAKRFSKIGSKPELSKLDVNSVLVNVNSYYRKRLPAKRKDIRLMFESGEPLWIMGNDELFTWVIENLVKNAIDAIQKANGIIQVRARETEKHIAIEVEDNGSGMPLKAQRMVFKPGFSTKKRGWGLGLTLAKRIIEDYHSGKIYIKSSHVEKGTVFVVKVPKIANDGDPR